MMNTKNSLTEGTVGRGLLHFAIPILCTSAFQSLNGSVNAIWIGRYLGEAALTAASNALAMMILLTGIAFGIATAAAILVGQCIGANKIAEAKHVIGTSATFFAVTSIAVAVAGLALSEPALVVMKVPADSLSMAVSYMRVMFLAVPSMYMYTFVMSLVVSAGDSKTPFYFMLLSVSLDIALNPLFIFGLGPIRGMGITGSALATFVTQTASIAALIFHLYRRRHPLCLHKNEWRLLCVDASIIRTLVVKGIPMSAQVLVASLSGVFMIVLVNRFGVDTTAAFGASMQFWMYIQMPAGAIGMAVAMMAAQNVGAQQWGRVNSIARVGIVYSVVLTSLVVLLFYALEIHLYRLLLPSDSPALFIARHINAVIVWSFVFLCIPVVLFGVVRAAGAVMVPLVIHVLSLLLVRFPLAALLINRWQADAIWWSFPISSALALVLAVLYYRYGGWRKAGLRIPIPVRGAPVPFSEPPS